MPDSGYNNIGYGGMGGSLQLPTGVGLLKQLAGPALALAVAGADYISPIAASQTITGDLAVSGKVTSGPGSSTVPGLAVGATNFGFFQTTGVLGVVHNGGKLAQFVASGLEITGALTLSVIRPGSADGLSNFSNLFIYTPTQNNALGLNITALADRNATSGIQRAVYINQATASAGVFAPTSGTAAFRCLDIEYSVNQTGGANGVITGIRVNATETALLGAHNLLDLMVGGSSKFRVEANGSLYASNFYTVGGIIASSGTDMQVRGWVSNSAGQRALRSSNVLAMTAANDRFIHTWYRGNLTDVAMELTSHGSLALGGSGSYSDAGGAVLYLKDLTSEPTTNITGGTLVYSFGGVLKARGSAGIVTL